MNTRHAKPGTPPPQVRFASCFVRGLLGNLVAKRCSLLKTEEEQELIWFLQWLSWQPEGLSCLPESLAPIAGTWCLDPSSELTGSEIESLTAFRDDWRQKRGVGRVHTSVGKRIFEALDYTRRAETICLIDGSARLGKSFAARAWCEASAGLARYVEVPSSMDEAAFLHRIAKAVGISSNLNSKATELRLRLEDVLQTGGLMLVFDEAHYLWPQGRLSHASSPNRVNWINTALANFGVPVALITTPQFYLIQRYVEKQSGWNSEQFIGRIGHVERLPERLHTSDLVRVAGALFPEGDEVTLRKLAIYAEVSKKHLASIEAIVKRARWIASRRGRDKATGEDVDRAIDESVIPSDSAIASLLGPKRFGGLVADDAPSRRGMGAIGALTRRGSDVSAVA